MNASNAHMIPASRFAVGRADDRRPDIPRPDAAQRWASFLSPTCGKIHQWGVFGPLALLLACLPWIPGHAFASGGGDHVRVVLDISKSMSSRLRDGSGPNDPGRLAVLATMLLHDLVDPNPRDPSRPDSFQVIPFKPDWPHWTDPAQPPPTGTGAPIAATSQDPSERSAFWERLRSLPYDGDWTYFYPGLEAAYASLSDPGITAADRKLIVLVTDGLPEPEVRERESELLMALRERLLDAGIELYVLAFGPVAEREHAFFDGLFAGPRGGDLGARFIDPTGRDLVLNMARIFSRSFGYQVEPIGTGGATRTIDLDGGITPPKVSVVAMVRGDREPPGLRIQPAVNAVRGLMVARETGAAYGILSIEGVRPGPHQLIGDTDGADVAILRRVEPELSVLPGHVEREGAREEMRQARGVIAETPFVLRVLAASPTGASGGQAELGIGFRQHGPREEGCSYRWTSDFQSADPGSRTRFDRGVTYDIRMTFPPNAEDPGRPYPAFVEVISKYQGEVVGTLDCDRAHPLTVFPRIGIEPTPTEGFLTPRALAPSQSGRVSFTLSMDEPQKLDVLGTTAYSLRAELEALEPGLEEGALAGAVMRLDGEPIAWSGQDSPWLRGRELTREQLLGPHELSIEPGDPRIERPSGDLPLRLRLTLLHPPYDDFRAIAPFGAKLKVVPLLPPPLDGTPTTALWAFALALLALLLPLLLVARRYPLPSDLVFRLAPLHEGGSATMDRILAGRPWGNLPRARPLAWLASPIRPARPIDDPDTGLPICWIKPLDQGLYGLRLRANASAEEADGTRLPTKRGISMILTSQIYRIRGPKGQWLLQVGFSGAERAERAPAVHGQTVIESR